VKKEPKNFYLLRAAIGFPIGHMAGSNEQKFFGSFFQKRTAAFLNSPQ
jgi:hypothetical protein